MEIIILAGGFGKRLSHIVKGVPKPMAPIRGVPFLVYVLNNLKNYNTKKIIMATGYKANIIEKYFGDNYKGIKIIYSTEKNPLGTGGAIKKALTYCDNKEIVVLNGDTYFEVDLDKIIEFHKSKKAKVTIAVKKMFNFDRYGTIEMNNGSVVSFNEKKPVSEGYINGGTYVLDKNIFNNLNDKYFSFEKDFMEKNVNNGYFKYFESKGYFIDIGIPEDYQKAIKELQP